MKKLAAILLLGILFFNWLGYQLLTDYWQIRSNARLEASFDQNRYDASELKVVKVPLRMPYQVNQTDFERFDGEIEIDGVYYKYVMRRVYNDSLILLCLPNEKKAAIDKAKNNFYKLVNNLEANSKSSGANKIKSIAVKNLMTDVLPDKASWSIDKYATVSITYSLTPLLSIPSTCRDVPEQPPRKNNLS